MLIMNLMAATKFGTVACTLCAYTCCFTLILPFPNLWHPSSRASKQIKRMLEKVSENDTIWHQRCPSQTEQCAHVMPCWLTGTGPRLKDDFGRGEGGVVFCLVCTMFQIKLKSFLNVITERIRYWRKYHWLWVPNPLMAHILMDLKL